MYMDNFSPVYYDFLRGFFNTPGAVNIIHIDTLAKILDVLDFFLRNINYQKGSQSEYYNLGEITGNYVFKNKTKTIFENLNRTDPTVNQYYGRVSKYNTLRKRALTWSTMNEPLTNKTKDEIKKQYSIFVYKLRKIFDTPDNSMIELSKAFKTGGTGLINKIQSKRRRNVFNSSNTNLPNNMKEKILGIINGKR